MDEAESTTSGGGSEQEHFSYYAFDGRTGALRWQHEAGDFYDIDPHAEEQVRNKNATSLTKNLRKESLLPEHSYKLHVLGQDRHLGEADWREFREHILGHLPHYWSSSRDTFFSLSRFARQHTSARASSPDGQDRNAVPNVVISHTESGLEVIHLYTGRTLCRLALLPDSLYDDLNADGLIDTVKLTSNSEGAQCATSANSRFG
jgi:hypothetical protein